MELIVDIETCGVELESLAESQQEYLLRAAEKECDETVKAEKMDDAKRYLSLYPFTAELVTIAFLNIDSGRTFVLCNSDKDENLLIEEKKIKYKMATEETMLKSFWHYVKQSKRIITFKGRTFDLPFLYMRSAMKKIKPTKNLLGNRFDTKSHLDLLEQFTYYGVTRKFNLDFYCHAFGIESPKGKGITGMEVKELFKAGKTKEIGVYCADDVRATFELYKIWEEYLKN
ncbi:MAG: ribonuclease H-like domain-containing protein [Bacteroidetes bacterium]|nr:ribonuclease H-like domain-containing protein [Bacteroidota bacterium]